MGFMKYLFQQRKIDIESTREFKGNIKVYRDTPNATSNILVNSKEEDIRKYQFLSNNKTGKIPLIINIDKLIIKYNLDNIYQFKVLLFIMIYSLRSSFR